MTTMGPQPDLGWDLGSWDGTSASRIGIIVKDFTKIDLKFFLFIGIINKNK